MKLLFSKGSPLIVQLFVALFLSIILMVLDTQYRAFQVVRYYLDTAISPLYYISNGPRSAMNSFSEMAKTRDELVLENTLLKNELLIKQNDLLLLEQLKHENDRLRVLLVSPVRRDEHKMAVQVLLTDTNPYAYQIVLNKGARNGVYVGQPVVDEKGIVGQIFATAENTSRAILICDFQHAIPVQVLRNDMSMVAVGNGCSEDLILEFLPNNIDIQEGDVLVTSGLDGRFPEGYPVATVSSINTNPNHAGLLIKATPTAELKRLRYLLLLWAEDRENSVIPAVTETSSEGETSNDE
ncbi:rod shape-determining protein MreC [Zophobihabitans entericus]|uniref:Cell shape-determining protein MreC n=1 Tax=Zophobihabitans entericus TaxID=1635327 RepID=A0A6G9I932_9GAMM|nr:rod shape-determining protein MreC [Zophobihabitans entericus]QIQ20725.1 rod shape-determining protein MreC [Zophobihabitans entericus]